MQHAPIADRSEPAGAPDGRTRVFISYSRRNEAAVVRIAQALAADAHIDVLRDKDDILPAEDWNERLGAMIQSADAFALFLSPEAAASVEVGREVDTALNLSKRIVPVVVSDTPPASVATAIAKLNYIFLREGDDFNTGIAAVRAAVQTDIAWVREHTRIGEMAARWQADGRHGADLLRGPTLDAAEAWLSRQPEAAPPVAPLQHEFIAQGRLAATRRLRGWVAGSAAVAVLAIGLSIVALWQRHQATVQRTDAQAKRLVAQAQAQLAEPLLDGEGPVQSILASLALNDGEEARQALARGIQRLEPLPVATLPLPVQIKADAPLRLVFRPDGRQLVAVSAQGLAAWSVPQGKLLWSRSVDALPDAARLVFSADGLHALLMPGARVVDMSNGRVAPRVHSDVLDVAEIDGRLVVLTGVVHGREVQLADALSGLTLARVTLSAPLQQGRLMGRVAHAPVVSGGPGMQQVLGAQQEGAAVLVDTKGLVTLVPVMPPAGEPPAQVSTWALPVASQFLGLGPGGRIMVLRQADGGRAMYDVLSRQVVWQGAAGTLPPMNLRLQLLEHNASVMVEDPRRSDWDVQALGDVERYSAIIQAATSRDGDVIATAWKDGRIDVWRPGLKARFGALGAMPYKNFESVARFDHGEALGATVTWSAPTPLLLSPSGRFVASQSMGLKTTAVGGATVFHPKVRVWDTRSGTEVARFTRPSGMALQFSSTDEWLVTQSMANRTDPDARPRLELWALASPQPTLDRRSSRLAWPAAASQLEDGRSLLFPVRTSTRVWVGLDRQLHRADPAQGRVVVLGDLGPALQQATARWRADIQALASGTQPTLDEVTRDVLAGLAKTDAWAASSAMQLPTQVSALARQAPASTGVVATSGDGHIAVVKLGPWLWVHRLDAKAPPRAVELSGDLGFDPNALAAPMPVVSRNGRFAAVERVDAAALLAQMRAMQAQERPSDAAAVAPLKPLALQREIVVVDLDSGRVTATWNADRKVWPQTTPLGWVHTASRLLAVSDDGQRLALQRQEFALAAGALPQLLARLEVVDLSTHATLLQGPAVLQPSVLDVDAQAHHTPMAAAFSPSGRRLVTDETRPACPLHEVTNLTTLMPTRQPSCHDVATRLTWWDVDHGRALNTLAYARQGTPPPPAAMPALGSAAGGQHVPATLAMSDEATVTRASTAWVAGNGPPGPPFAVETIDERMVLDQAGGGVEAACRRLPREWRTITPERWAAQFPGENWKLICPEKR